MSEEATTELEAGEGQQAETPTSEFGMGFLSDKAPGESGPVEGDPEGSEATGEGEPIAEPEPASTDLNALSLDNISAAQLRQLQDGNLRQSDYSRKTDDLSKGQKTLADEKAAFLQEQKDFHAAQLEAARAPQQQTELSQSANLRQMLQNTPAQSDANPQGLSAADRQGYEYLAGIMEQNETLNTTVQGLQKQVEEMSPQFEETSQTVNQLTEAKNKAQIDDYKTQVTEADRLFGEGQSKLHGKFVVNNLGQINPATNEPFTIPELVGMASGKTVAEAEKARAANKTTRQRTKQSVAPAQSPSLVDAEGANISEAAAIAEIGKTM